MKKVLAVFLVIASILVLSGAVKAEVYTALTPHLVNLRGWEAEKAEGVDLNMPGMSMVNATRTYVQGDKELNAVIMIGNKMMIPGQTDFEMDTSKFDMNTSEFSVSTKKINGFEVYCSYNKAEKEGSIMVFLEKGETEGTFFMLSFSNIDEKEALNLAKQFDWAKIKKAAAGAK